MEAVAILIHEIKYNIPEKLLSMRGLGEDFIEACLPE